MRREDRPHAQPPGPPALDRRNAEALILEHLPEIAAVCARQFRQASDAEDATHEAVLAILRALPSYRGDGPVRHWMLKVALNAARMHRRRRHTATRRETALPEREPAGGNMTLSADDRDERAAVRAAIAELPESLREAVVLYYDHHLTQAEIADVLGCSQKTVSVRLKKGLEHLERRFAGTPALGALTALGGLIAAGTAAAPVFDPVSPQLVASVQSTIASHFAEAATTSAITSTSTAGSSATGSSLGAASATAGGIVMNAKLIAGATVLAVTCLLTGAVVSEQFFASGPDADTQARITKLEQELDDVRGKRDTLAQELESTRDLNTTRMASLGDEVTRLRNQLAERDRDASTHASAETAAADRASTPETRGEEERWAAIQKSMAGVMRILAEMEKEGANQFELGPQMVAELGKMSLEDFEAMAEFDADASDPRVRAEIRAVMLQAFIFVPKTAPLRDGYMARYLERVQDGASGPDYDLGALRRLAFRMPPFVDAYAKIVTPMNDDLKRGFVDAALKRAADGANPVERHDGVLFLARTKDPRAAEQLTRIVRQTNDPARLRIAAAKGLAESASEDVLRALRDQESIETDADVKSVISQVAAGVEQRIAAQK